MFSSMTPGLSNSRSQKGYYVLREKYNRSEVGFLLGYYKRGGHQLPNQVIMDPVNGFQTMGSTDFLRVRFPKRDPH